MSIYRTALSFADSEKMLKRDIEEATRRHLERIKSIERISGGEPALHSSYELAKTRRKQFRQLQENGLSRSQIAQKLGISIHRVGEIAKSIEEAGGVELSVRAANAIRRVCNSPWKTPITPQTLADANLHIKDFADLPNCGEKTANEIIIYAKKHGIKIQTD